MANDQQHYTAKKWSLLVASRSHFFDLVVIWLGRWPYEEPSQGAGNRSTILSQDSPNEVHRTDLRPEGRDRRGFRGSVAEAIAATGEPAENVGVIVNEIVEWQRPAVDDIGHA